MSSVTPEKFEIWLRNTTILCPRQSDVDSLNYIVSLKHELSSTRPCMRLTFRELPHIVQNCLISFSTYMVVPRLPTYLGSSDCGRVQFTL